MSIEAMKLALDALENIIDAIYVNSEMEAIAVKHANIVITALKERLAQPEQEPVAWMWDVNNGGGYTTRDVGLYKTNIPFAKHTPLYAHPPQLEERNFCSRCGKRTKDLTHIHTCTPPKKNT